MNIAKYLIELLLQQDEVQVSGLGTFKTPYIASKINVSRNTIEAPRKTIIFDADETPLLQDDLSQYVAVREQIGQEQAEEVVEAFVQSLKNDTLHLGHTALEGLGTFVYDANGNLKLIAEMENQFNKETFAMNEIELPATRAISDIAQEVPSEEMPVAAGASYADEEMPKKKTVSSVLETNVLPKEKPATPVPAAASPVFSSHHDTPDPTPAVKQAFSGIPEEPQNELSSTEPHQYSPKPPPFKMPPKRQKNTEGSWIWAIPTVAVLLLGLLAAQYLLYEDPRNESPILSRFFGDKDNSEQLLSTESADTEVATDTETTPAENTTPTEETTTTGAPAETSMATTENDVATETNTSAAAEVTKEPVKTEVVAPPTPVKNTDKNEGNNSNNTATTSAAPKGYHIVVGVFKEKSNATKMVKTMKSKGFDAYVIADGGARYRATVYAGSSESDAISKLPDVQSKSGESNAWYFKR